MAKSSSEILTRAKETLATARLGERALASSDPNERMAGLRNLIVFGRAVTNVLQNLRSTESAFDEWYAPHRDRMAADPLLKHLYELRSQILKEGSLPVHSGVTFSGNLGEALRHGGTLPVGAKAFFIGDKIGGSGWEVELSDGSIEKYYVALPTRSPNLSVDIRVHLTGVPKEFQNATIQEIGSHYLQGLQDLVAEANSHFGHKPPPA